MSSAPALRPTSILLIEPEKGLVLKLQDLLMGHFRTALDLAIAGSLREGMTHLCTHPVALTLMSLSLPDYKGLDAVRAVRLAVPQTALIVYGATQPLPLLLDAVRAGAHGVLFLTDTSAATFHLTVECALIRATQPAIQAGSSAPVQTRTGSATMPRLVHDLNNSIMSINGFADLLLNRLPAEEPARVCSEQIKRAGTRAATLLNSIAALQEPAPSVLPATNTDLRCTVHPAPILSSN
jgi:DNA-binding NarL/FixJ family response regulator